MRADNILSYDGPWIKMVGQFWCLWMKIVASYMGAWIKIVDMQYPLFLCRIPCGVWIKASYRKNTWKNVALNNIKTHHKGMEEIWW